jgi:hypothetical protein
MKVAVFESPKGLAAFYLDEAGRALVAGEPVELAEVPGTHIGTVDKAAQTAAAGPEEIDFAAEAQRALRVVIAKTPNSVSEAKAKYEVLAEAVKEAAPAEEPMMPTAWEVICRQCLRVFEEGIEPAKPKFDHPDIAPDPEEAEDPATLPT